MSSLDAACVSFSLIPPQYPLCPSPRPPPSPPPPPSPLPSLPARPPWLLPAPAWQCGRGLAGQRHDQRTQQSHHPGNKRGAPWRPAQELSWKLHVADDRDRSQGQWGECSLMFAPLPPSPPLLCPPLLSSVMRARVWARGLPSLHSARPTLTHARASFCRLLLSPSCFHRLTASNPALLLSVIRC